MEVERLGPARVDALGRELSPVRLTYPGRTSVTAAVDRTVVVALEPGVVASSLGLRLLRPLMPSAGLWLAEDDGDADAIDVAARLAGQRSLGVREAVPNLYLRLKAHTEPFVPNDPRYPSQWFFGNLGMEQAWGLSRGDAATGIVIIDTGCDGLHVDLVDKMDAGRDVLDGDDDPSPDLGHPGANHGTACAGVAAASTNNGEGIAGACPDCRLRCVRMLQEAPTPISTDIEAFQFALEVGAAVVSNSWGFAEPTPVPQPLADAIDNVYRNGRDGKGALVIFAAGNDDREIGNDELQALPSVLCVGAINNFDDQTQFTNRGAAIDLVAPTGTLTTDITGPGGDDPGDYTSLFGGTSSACPVVAGVAGLLVSAAPDASAAALYEVLVKTSTAAPYAQPDANGHDLVFGYGIVDPTAALRDLLGIVDPPPEGDGGSDAAPVESETSSCHAAGTGGRTPGWLALLAVAVPLALGRRRRTRRRDQTA